MGGVTLWVQARGTFVVDVRLARNGFEVETGAGQKGTGDRWCFGSMGGSGGGPTGGMDATLGRPLPRISAVAGACTLSQSAAAGPCTLSPRGGLFLVPCQGLVPWHFVTDRVHPGFWRGVYAVVVTGRMNGISQSGFASGRCVS